MTLDSLIIPLLIALVAVPMFLQTRKQKRAMQEQQNLQNSLTVGDRVMTTSGLFGTVAATAEETVDLEIAPGVVTSWLRAAVREKVDTESAESTQTESAEAASGAKESGSDESGAQIAEPIEQQAK